jgi:hypothetical protein
MLYHCDSIGDVNKMMTLIEEGGDKEDKERHQLLQQFKLIA